MCFVNIYLQYSFRSHLRVSLALVHENPGSATDLTGLSNNREIRVFPGTVGNTGISREIPGNIGKYREIVK